MRAGAGDSPEMGEYREGHRLRRISERRWHRRSGPNPRRALRGRTRHHLSSADPPLEHLGPPKSLQPPSATSFSTPRSWPPACTQDAPLAAILARLPCWTEARHAANHHLCHPLSSSHNQSFSCHSAPASNSRVFPETSPNTQYIPDPTPNTSAKKAQARDNATASGRTRDLLRAEQSGAIRATAQPRTNLCAQACKLVQATLAPQPGPTRLLLSPLARPLSQGCSNIDGRPTCIAPQRRAEHRPRATRPWVEKSSLPKVAVGGPTAVLARN